MAAALLDHHAQGRVHVRSADSAPSDQIYPAVAAAMDEQLLDTADTYTHVMPAHSAEAVPTVAALFERPSRLILPPTAGASEEA